MGVKEGTCQAKEEQEHFVSRRSEGNQLHRPCPSLTSEGGVVGPLVGNDVGRPVGKEDGVVVGVRLGTVVGV